MAQLLGIHSRIRIIERQATIFGRLGDTKDSQSARLFEDLMRGKFLRLLPLVRMRIDFCLDKAPHRASYRRMFFGKYRHAASLNLALKPCYAISGRLQLHTLRVAANAQTN